MGAALVSAVVLATVGFIMLQAGWLLWREADEHRNLSRMVLVLLGFAAVAGGLGAVALWWAFMLVFTNV
jgi:hypothetical protein